MDVHHAGITVRRLETLGYHIISEHGHIVVLGSSEEELEADTEEVEEDFDNHDGMSFNNEMEDLDENGDTTFYDVQMFPNKKSELVLMIPLRKKVKSANCIKEFHKSSRN